jgi:hypothetical protein
MNIALLFDAGRPGYGGWYGATIMRAILGTGVIQRSNCHMRTSIGDILTSRLGSSRVAAAIQAVGWYGGLRSRRVSVRFTSRLVTSFRLPANAADPGLYIPGTPVRRGMVTSAGSGRS